MYLAGRMGERTVVLLTGREIGLIPRACAMARLLQPSMVILEDVDLIAEERDRSSPAARRCCSSCSTRWTGSATTLM